VEYRKLAHREIEHFRDLDRREVVEQIYYHRRGQLVLEQEYHDVPPWSTGQQDAFIGHIRQLHEDGGTVIGAWDASVLVGMITLGRRLMGDRQDLLNVNGLWVSREYRRRGVASTLMALLTSEATSRGAKGLYVSATPSKNTVEFYMRQGFELAETVDPQLFELEPEDIHMVTRF